MLDGSKTGILELWNYGMVEYRKKLKIESSSRKHPSAALPSTSLRVYDMTGEIWKARKLSSDGNDPSET